MKHKNKLLILYIVSVCFLLCGCDKQQEETFFSMDTVMNIKIYGKENIMPEINELITKFDRLFDRNKNDSDISRLNHGIKSEVNSHTADMISTALSVSRLSGGAFDITIAPVMDSWGFYDKQFRVPSKSEIIEAKKAVDYKKVSVNGNIVYTGNALIDAGGIAKGYLSDIIASEIRNKKIKSAVMSLGGNIYCVGKRPDGQNWKIGIKDPQNPDSSIGYVNVYDTAVVTSGTYERSFTENGIFYHHIINPHTGFPADSGLSSVTVICKSGARADALSTAFFVLGRDESMKIKEEDVEIIFITDNNEIYATENVTLHTDKKVNILLNDK